ncbi:hypothetical protein [Lyngbya aestuarii]|uniref:hypothetical protein n=1 Tax=Lyngbya aestuarii TaxID=118322 RepID=UPI00403D74E5
MNLTPELIRAFTPLFLGTMGTLIGMTALLTAQDHQDTRLTAALGLAGTAIAGAAGLAQSHQSETGVSIRKDGQKFKIDSPPPSSPQDTSQET